MSRYRTAVFGCGCFWTKEHLFRQLRGVVQTRVGFSGGWAVSPTYQEVCGKATGHSEVVEVTYNADVIRYPELIKAFFSFHDATMDRSGKGGQYRSVVFFKRPKEQIIAQRAIDELIAGGINITTAVEPCKLFWLAEDRHQNYVDRTGHHREKCPNPQLSSLSLCEAAQLGHSTNPIAKAS